MSKTQEALKLAQDLRALADRFSEGWHEGIKIDALDIELLSNAAEALAEQPAQQQEPVAICEYCEKERPVIQTEGKPWVGLDRKEMFAIIDQQKADKRTGLPMFWRDQVGDIARAIEAKLREKNA